MKIVKMGAILGIVVTALLSILWILDLVPGPQASEALKRGLAVVAVVTFACVLVTLVAGKSEDKTP